MSATTEHQAHIMQETLAITLAITPEQSDDQTLPLSFDIDDYTLKLSIERVD